MGHQSSIASEPGQRPFDHPSPTHDLEAARVIRAFYDFQLNRLPRERCFELLSSIAAVGEDFSEPWEQMARLADQIGSAVAVLDVGRDHCDAKKQPIVSTMTLRLMPLVFFPASYPTGSL